MNGGVITCYVFPCSAELLAHEMGHILGLSNATATSCNGHVMYEYGGTRHLFGDACTAADAAWLGPMDPAPEPVEPVDPPLTDQDCGPDGCSPLILDLNGDGVRTTGVDRPVSFDIDSDGILELITWTDALTSEGFLWIDLNPNGIVDDGSELFGIGTGLPTGERASDGFEALAVYDQLSRGGNADGKIDRHDAIWGRLRIWIDENHDGISQHTESGPIHMYGVQVIHLDYELDLNPDENGNLHKMRGTYLRRVVGSGPAHLETFAMDDVFFVGVVRP